MGLGRATYYRPLMDWARRDAPVIAALTTLVASAEPKAQELLGLAPHEAVAAMLLCGRPRKQITKLKRRPVEAFTFRERADGEMFTI